MDRRREGGPEEDGCHKLEDTCTQKRRLEGGREGGQGPTRTVEPWSSSSTSSRIWKLENAREVQQEAEGTALVLGEEEENLIHDVAYRDEEMASLLPVTF